MRLDIAVIGARDHGARCAAFQPHLAALHGVNILAATCRARIFVIVTHPLVGRSYTILLGRGIGMDRRRGVGIRANIAI